MVLGLEGVGRDGIEWDVLDMDLASFGGKRGVVMRIDGIEISSLRTSLAMDDSLSMFV